MHYYYIRSIYKTLKKYLSKNYHKCKKVPKNVNILC